MTVPFRATGTFGLNPGAVVNLTLPTENELPGNDEVPPLTLTRSSSIVITGTGTVVASPPSSIIAGMTAETKREEKKETGEIFSQPLVTTLVMRIVNTSVTLRLLLEDELHGIPNRQKIIDMIKPPTDKKDESVDFYANVMSAITDISDVKLSKEFKKEAASQIKNIEEDWKVYDRFVIYSRKTELKSTPGDEVPKCPLSTEYISWAFGVQKMIAKFI